MAWRVGLDEAGLGPNLGPMVMASTACQVPEQAPESLWELLGSFIRKKEGRDQRLIIDDSKKVHAAKDGLSRLERVALALLPQRPGTLAEYLRVICLGTSEQDLLGEIWLQSDKALPAYTDPLILQQTQQILASAAQDTGLQWGPVHGVILPATRFNEICKQWGNKSATTRIGVVQLLRKTLDLPGEDPIAIAVDRLGGRQYYSPLLNEAFPQCWPIPIRETPECCEYRLEGLNRSVQICFEPRADGNHLNVALASMTAKYLRELFMEQFNAFWIDLIPDLQPTAGYPVDAGRFMNQIRDTMVSEGISERSVWRIK